MAQDNRAIVNASILSDLEVLANRTVDYYLDKDNGNLLSTLKTTKDTNELSNTVANLLAREILTKFNAQ